MTTSTSGEPTTTTVASPDTTTTAAAAVTTTTTVAATTSTTLQVDVEVSGGEVNGPDRFEVTRGDDFGIWVLSDTADELHVHGYDLFFHLTPGVPVNVAFSADVPGIFEVELETDHQFLFDIEVTG